MKSIYIATHMTGEAKPQLFSEQQSSGLWESIKPQMNLGKSLRELGLEATQNTIAFYPEWGRNRLRGMLESRPDWCISRQRAWGLANTCILK